MQGAGGRDPATGASPGLGPGPGSAVAAPCYRRRRGRLDSAAGGRINDGGARAAAANSAIVWHRSFCMLGSGGGQESGEHVPL